MTGQRDMRVLAETIDHELRARGRADRAAKEQVYLRSDLVHYGVSVPDTRAVVKSALTSTDSASHRRGARSVPLGHDDIVALSGALWSPAEPGAASVHERRAAATMVLIAAAECLGAGDAPLIEGMLREARTWALVDPLAGDLVGPLTERDPAVAEALEAWAVDADFWIRRSALLAHLVPLRRGRGDFDRFGRFADAMLEEKEFFIRKAIGGSFATPRAHAPASCSTGSSRAPIGPRG